MPARVTQLPAEVCRLNKGGDVRVTQLVLETVRPFSEPPPASGDGSAAASCTLAASARAGHTYHGSASVSATASGGVTARRLSLASASATAAVVAGMSRANLGRAFVHARVGLAASNDAGAGADGDISYIGRYQLGQAVPLWVLTRDRAGDPALPGKRPPVASVYNLDTHSHVGDLFVPRLTGPRSSAVFAGPLPLGADFAPGRHLVWYRWTVGGFKGSSGSLFEVQAGGDPVGPLIAAKVSDLADAQALLCQAASGRLLTARSPYLPGGISR